MRRIIVYETSDGIRHDDLPSALRHADKRLGMEISGLAHEALRQDKYSKMSRWIEENIDRMAELRAIRDDLTLVPDEE